MFRNINLKKAAGYTAIVMTVSFTLSVFIFFSTGGVESLMAGINNSEKANVNLEKTVEIEGLDNINIDTSSVDVNIIPEKRNDVRVLLTGYTTAKQPELSVQKGNGTIGIRVRNKNIFVGINIINLKLDIYVPENYSNNLKINTASGDINVGRFNLESFYFDGASGNLTTSDFVSKLSNIEISSGDVKLKGFMGDLVVRSQSGNINVEYIAFSNNIDMNASSGDITLKLPKDSQFNLKTTTSSGDINCDFEVASSGERDEDRLEGTVGSSDNQIILHTSSGNVDIEN